MFGISEDEVKRIRENYPEGCCVRLVYMGSDPRPIPYGMKGTVRVVDDIGTVHVAWDNGRGLGVVMGEDTIVRID